jgi:prepilin-type N-terminal cleavage/methylation domain-containing protein
MRRAFTLIELLVVITIIGMLASMALTALYMARESAREAKTQSTIAKLDIVAQEQFAELHARRAPFGSRILGRDYNLQASPLAIAVLRLQALRWIAKTEMPTLLTDVEYPKPNLAPAFRPVDIDTPVKLTASANVFNPATNTMVLETWEVPIRRTAAARRIFRKVAANPPTGDNSPAELFYMWVMSIDPDAKERFQPNEIADVDGDGHREFVDGWGHPIKFLRWPTGFEQSEVMTGDAENDHDPFDVRTVDPVAFRTVSLVWSNGPDGLSGLDLVGKSKYAWDEIYMREYGKPVLPSDPDFGHEAGHHHDNITNHSLGMN